MGLRSTYPTMFDSTEILSPTSWKETSNVIETVNQSEAGTDLVDVTRYDKLIVDASYTIAETCETGGVGNGWAKTFKEFSKKPSFTLKRYDPLVGGYEERTVRMRKFSADIVKKSDLFDDINGAWRISFTLEEF